MATQPRPQEELPSYTDNELALISVRSALLEAATSMGKMRCIGFRPDPAGTKRR